MTMKKGAQNEIDAWLNIEIHVESQKVVPENNLTWLQSLFNWDFDVAKISPKTPIRQLFFLN